MLGVIIILVAAVAIGWECGYFGRHPKAILAQTDDEAGS